MRPISGCSGFSMISALIRWARRAGRPYGRWLAISDLHEMERRARPLSAGDDRHAIRNISPWRCCRRSQPISAPGGRLMYMAATGSTGGDLPSRAARPHQAAPRRGRDAGLGPEIRASITTHRRVWRHGAGSADPHNALVAFRFIPRLRRFVVLPAAPPQSRRPAAGRLPVRRHRRTRHRAISRLGPRRRRVEIDA